MFKRLLFIGYDFGKHMSRRNISAFAASTAFFLFLSLIPALMLLCAIIPYTPLTEANLMSAARKISPDAMDSLLINII
ncbi:MAG: YihY/virulence factor BrkB family protein, partial [Lachnospiraceae bacterium]|nr:YihY/virulence factor BrkB family protein [Lachnospiraceae bacterium]